MVIVLTTPLGFTLFLMVFKIDKAITRIKREKPIMDFVCIEANISKNMIIILIYISVYFTIIIFICVFSFLINGFAVEK